VSSLCRAAEAELIHDKLACAHSTQHQQNINANPPIQQGCLMSPRVYCLRAGPHLVCLRQHDLGVLGITNVNQQVARSDEAMHMPLHVQPARECIAKQPNITAKLSRSKHPMQQINSCICQPYPIAVSSMSTGAQPIQSAHQSNLH
jgi:hypothetical protein